MFENSRYKTYFDSKESAGESPIIIFDPTQGMEFDEYSNWIIQGLFGGTGKRSPAEALLHELGHAKSFFDDPKKHKKDSIYPMGAYGNAEEYDVIINEL